MTNQKRILDVIRAGAGVEVMGRDIAAATGLKRKQVEDALCVLSKKRLIVRKRRNRKAGWLIWQSNAITGHELQRMFNEMCRG